MKKITKKQARELAKELLEKEVVYIDGENLRLISIKELKTLYKDTLNSLIYTIYSSKLDYETIRKFLFDDYVIVTEVLRFMGYEKEVNHKDYFELEMYDGDIRLSINTEPFLNRFYLDELNITWFMRE